MKKFYNILLILLLIFLNTIKTEAMTFQEGFARINQKPMVLLIYANWADGYQNCIQQFRATKAQLSKEFNFVELNIASNDAKAFNDKYAIERNLPYVMMLRNGGKVTKYIQKSCAADSYCLNSKLRSFIQH